MKLKIAIILITLGVCVAAAANKSTFFSQNNYSITGKFVGGYIFPMSKNLVNTAKKPMLGAELAIEFPNLTKHNWYRYLGEPTVGATVAYYNLGNDDVLGSVVALYPYLLVPIVDNGTFRLDYKIGAGLSFFNKRWNTCDTLHGVNAETANSAIGSVVNAYITTGLGMNVAFSSNWQLRLGVDYVHMSNGSVLQPNSGINMITASIGATYVINNYCVSCNKSSLLGYLEPFPYEWSINMSLSGGARELYYRDNKMYPTGSFHLGATYHIAPFYAVGGGLDMFYDGVFVVQGTTADMSPAIKVQQQVNTHFNKYLITEDAIGNKFRAGVSLSNEFIIGRVTAILDWGIYFYDPIRNKYDPKVMGDKKRGMFYKYNIDREDGWNYFRLGLRCRVWNNLFLQTSLKSHLHKAEFIEFGIGYQIPFKRKSDSGALSGGGWDIYYHDAKYKRPQPMLR